MSQQIPFGFTSTASEVLAGVDLSGKTMIVTGGQRHRHRNGKEPSRRRCLRNNCSEAR